jgi:tetratricopeptide (TPR) repeat protein
MLVPAHRALGNLYASRAQLPQAVEQLRLAVAEADALIRVERNNSQWLGAAARARLNLAELQLAAQAPAAAAAETSRACTAVGDLLARDGTVQQWRLALRDCHGMRARLALAGGSPAGALGPARQALGVAQTIKSGDAAADAYAVARAYRLLGDVHKAAGEGPAAQAAWARALAALPRRVAERPSEMSDRALTLERLGRAGEARQLTTRLNSIGYTRVG